jgi:hypothetical protein
VVTSFEVFGSIKKSKWWAVIWICTRVLKIPESIIVDSELNLEALWEESFHATTSESGGQSKWVNHPMAQIVRKGFVQPCVLGFWCKFRRHAKSVRDGQNSNLFGNTLWLRQSIIWLRI